MRSERSVLSDGLFKNKYLVLSFFAGTAAQLALIYFPPAARLFELCPLSIGCLSLCFALSILPLVIVELQKRMVHNRAK